MLQKHYHVVIFALFLTVFFNILVFGQNVASVRHSRMFSRLIKING